MKKETLLKTLGTSVTNCPFLPADIQPDEHVSDILNFYLDIISRAICLAGGYTFSKYKNPLTKKGKIHKKD